MAAQVLSQKSTSCPTSGTVEWNRVSVDGICNWLSASSDAFSSSLHLTVVLLKVRIHCLHCRNNCKSVVSCEIRIILLHVISSFPAAAALIVAHCDLSEPWCTWSSSLWEKEPVVVFVLLMGKDGGERTRDLGRVNKKRLDGNRDTGR